MVEAALYFPITIAVVMAVIYLGLFKMQESYFFFQVERTAAQRSWQKKLHIRVMKVSLIKNLFPMGK